MDGLRAISDQNVGRFDIPVSYAAAFKVLNRLQHLVHKAFDMAFVPEILVWVLQQIFHSGVVEVHTNFHMWLRVTLNGMVADDMRLAGRQRVQNGKNYSTRGR